MREGKTTSLWFQFTTVRTDGYAEHSAQGRYSALRRFAAPAPPRLNAKGL